MTTLLFSDPLFEKHDTGSHPESPARLRSIAVGLAKDHLAEQCLRGEIHRARMDDLALIHGSKQIANVERLATSGGGYADPDTPISAASFDVALQAAGSAMAAVDGVMSGRATNALCLIRPPGHHATATASMGFCLFNNIALAARHAQKKHGAGRVLIIDWDVHHGNGTQDIFYDDDSVFFYSIHRFPFYPGTGAADETGTGRGLGSTLNIPVAFGTTAKLYLELFEKGLDAAISKSQPDLILISAGFDAHARDPIGNLGLSDQDFAVMTQLTRERAASFCGGRVVSCLEGGYHLQALQESVCAHLQILQA